MGNAFDHGGALDQVAETLGRLALDESLKARVLADPPLRDVAFRVARRYVAGRTIDDALQEVVRVNRRGDSATVDYMGESCRDATRAKSETGVFVALSERLAEQGARSSISLDLSHIGLVVDEELGYSNAVRIAEATAANGQEMMLSMEAADRTDAVLRTHAKLCERFDNIGVTIQARLRRSAHDLVRLLDRPGRIRLVKGAYPEPESRAYPRGSSELADAYLGYAAILLRSGHLCSIATHDDDLLDAVTRIVVPDGRPVSYEFETLLGLGAQQLRRLRDAGHPTREYVVFGDEWWLYTCNRLVEDPSRLFQALVDAAARHAGE